MIGNDVYITKNEVGRGLVNIRNVWMHKLKDSKRYQKEQRKIYYDINKSEKSGTRTNRKVWVIQKKTKKNGNVKKNT